jgi:hypothetical protein
VLLLPELSAILFELFPPSGLNVFPPVNPNRYTFGNVKKLLPSTKKSYCRNPGSTVMGAVA